MKMAAMRPFFCFMRAGGMFYVLYSAHKLTNTGENGMLKTGSILLYGKEG